MLNRDDTFEKDDIFNRKILADQLTRVINKSEELRDDSFVVAVDSSWGTGKSVFINKWINEVNLLKDEPYKKLNATTIYYNAWENDDSFDAFTPLAYHIYNDFNILVEKERLKEDLVDKIKEKSINVASAFTKVVARRFGIDDELINLLKQVISTGKEEYLKVKSTPFFEEFEEKKNFKKEFKDLISRIPNEIKDCEKLIIVIDELDRCRPTFAIETLEIIKHYFDIDNIIFVLALDIEQLGYAISTIYGQNMDATGYLRRFVDVTVKLPIPDKKAYIREKSNLDGMKGELLEIVNYYNMSIRDINKFIVNIELFYDYPKNKQFYGQQLIKYMYLIAIKLKYPIEFKQILTEKFKKGISSNQTVNVIDMNMKIFPTKMWDEFFDQLANGGNLLPINHINPSTNSIKLMDLVANSDIKLTTPIGEYIFKTIEMCVVNYN